MPDHPVARALLKNAGVPIVAPSANLSGKPSPTTAWHAREDLDGKIAAILDGGSCKIGLESTVLDITRKVPVILRPGGVTREEIERALGIQVRVARPTNIRPSSPGMKYRHYAPKAELLLIEGERRAVIHGMKKMADRLKKQKNCIRDYGRGFSQADVPFTQVLLARKYGSGQRGAEFIRGFPEIRSPGGGDDRMPGLSGRFTGNRVDEPSAKGGGPKSAGVIRYNSSTFGTSGINPFSNPFLNNSSNAFFPFSPMSIVSSLTYIFTNFLAQRIINTAAPLHCVWN